MKRLLNIKDASSFLNYNPFTVLQLVNRGLLKPFTHGKRKTLLFSEEDLKKLQDKLNPNLDKFFKENI